MRPPGLLAALGAALAACAYLPASGDPARATLIGTYVWDEPIEGFGGFSGLELDAGGTLATILSDRGRLGRARLTRDASGAVAGVELLSLAPLLDPQGQPLPGGRADSEGLAIAADGAAWISFEGDAGNIRVRQEARDGLPPAVLPGHPDWSGLWRNRALEALAVADDGTLLAIPERPAGGGDDFAVYAFRDGAWSEAFRLPVEQAFAVTGADVGPDGRLYLLERKLAGLGFQTALRRVALDGSADETLLVTASGTHDNLEGLAVWRDAAGLRATMISDDNFRFFQRTEIVDYRLPD